MYKSTKEIYKIFLPYCLKKIGDNEYIFLNREYLPLGMFRHGDTKFIDYKKHSTVFKFVTDNFDKYAKDICINIQENDGTLYYLYSGILDKNNMQDYQNRLNKLKDFGVYGQIDKYDFYGTEYDYYDLQETYIEV
jgi:hypothetical protein